MTENLYPYDGPAALREPVQQALRSVVDPELALSIDAVWHPRNDHDAGHKWFRELIHQILQEAYSKSQRGYIL